MPQVMYSFGVCSICDGDFQQKVDVNVDCCINCGHSESGYQFWKFENVGSFFTKSKLTKLWNIMRCLRLGPEKKSIHLLQEL
jgi:hypothetical protein